MAYRREVLAIIVVTLLCGASCPKSSTLPICGAFDTFQASAETNTTGQAGLLQMYFAYSESKCPCHCDKYGFVQAMRPIDLATGEFVHPNDDQQSRMVTGQADESLNGWAIDRVENRKYGYYKVDNDFQIEPALLPGELNRFGTAMISAAMHDTVSRGDLLKGRGVLIVFLTAAVCLDQSTTCAGHMLGLQKWYVAFGPDNTVSPPARLTATPGDVEAFRLAVESWNAHLDGRVGLPVFSFP